MNTNIVPVRVQRKRTRGFNLQGASPNGMPVVYVGRPSKWGNPYKVDDYHNRFDVMALYRFWLKEKLKDDPHFLDELKGKDLACFCPLDKPCHADVLLEELTKGDLRCLRK